MKVSLCLLFALVISLTCSKSDNVAGTTTDVNSGGITGQVLNSGSVYRDSVTVSLYTGNSVLSKITANSAGLIKSIITSDGTFKFDSLGEENYSIMVIKDGIVIGEEKGIQLKRGEQKTINITIVIIINQIFNITNIVNNQNVMINNITFSGTNGTFDSLSGNEYRVSFICVDTVYMSTNITIGSTSESVIMKFIKQPGGTYTGVLEGTLQQIKINTGATIINNGNGSDSSTVSISGKIKEEVR